MSIIDQLSLSKSGPSAFSKVAVNATNELFSTLLGSEILASINSRDTLAHYQTKSGCSQPYDRHQTGSLEFNDRLKNEIHSAKQPAPYEDDDSYKYNQITEKDSFEKEPTVTNATERSDNNEHTTENVRDDKQNLAGNHEKNNSSQSSQGRIEVDNGVLPTENIENSRRKPSPSMINEAVKKYNLIKKECFMIGDKETDLLAAKNASIRGFLFEGGDLSVKISKILKDHL